jgi:hypothetical protein
VLVARQHVRAGSGSLSAFVLAASVLLTNATQLRASVVPVGAGELLQDRGQGSERLRAWWSGLEAVSGSASSFLVGLGPGPHAYDTRSIWPMEAHNTYIDWCTTTGVIGLISLLLLLVFRTVKSGCLSLFGLMIALLVFSSTHFVLRQAVFWFALVLVANFTTPARTARQR